MSSDQGNHGAAGWLPSLLTLLVLALPACTSDDPFTAPLADPALKAGRTATFTALDLGTLPGGLISIATAINSRGQVVGWSGWGGGLATHAFLWDDGVMTDLGTLGGDYSAASDINAAGQVVGLSRMASGSIHAFLWDDGAIIDLGTLGGDFSSAEAINPAGQVVGWSTTASGDARGFSWDNGVMTDLGPFGASDINPAGHLIVHGEGSAFLSVRGTLTDLGNLGTVGGSTTAFDINPSDQIVGTSNGRAFLWEDGVMTDLGTPGPEFILSFARGINPAGQVVGSSEIAGERLIRGFFWDKGLMTVLEPVDGGYTSTAYAINARGQIVGEGSTAPGIVHATLWVRQ